MDLSSNTQAQPDFLDRYLWVLVANWSLEGMGLLFFDRLALSSTTCNGGKGYIIELYLIFGEKNNWLVTQSRIGGYIYGRFGGSSAVVFALGQSPKSETRKIGRRHKSQYIKTSMAYNSILSSRRKTFKVGILNFTNIFLTCPIPSVDKISKKLNYGLL